MYRCHVVTANSTPTNTRHQLAIPSITSSTGGSVYAVYILHAYSGAGLHVLATSVCHCVLSVCLCMVVCKHHVTTQHLSWHVVVMLYIACSYCGKIPTTVHGCALYSVASSHGIRYVLCMCGTHAVYSASNRRYQAAVYTSCIRRVSAYEDADESSHAYIYSLRLLVRASYYASVALKLQYASAALYIHVVSTRAQYDASTLRMQPRVRSILHVPYDVCGVDVSKYSTRAAIGYLLTLRLLGGWYVVYVQYVHVLYRPRVPSSSLDVCTRTQLPTCTHRAATNDVTTAPDGVVVTSTYNPHH